MKNIFLNIHGFGSSGSNSKAAALTENFPDHELISPDLPADPLECLEIIDAIVTEYKDRPLILQGSSMGGLYSMVMHFRHGVPALLVNPCLTPVSLIRSRLGEVYEFSNGESIIISEEHITPFEQVEEELEKGIAEKGVRNGEVLALIGEQDELLDQKVIKSILKRAGAGIISYNTDHRFEGFDQATRHDIKVRDFLLTIRD